jgi:hypothetical protein
MAGVWLKRVLQLLHRFDSRRYNTVRFYTIPYDIVGGDMLIALSINCLSWKRTENNWSYVDILMEIEKGSELNECSGCCHDENYRDMHQRSTKNEDDFGWESYINEGRLWVRKLYQRRQALRCYPNLWRELRYQGVSWIIQTDEVNIYRPKVIRPKHSFTF